MQKAIMPAAGAELELIISDLNSDGGSVARHEGLVYFLDKGLPGEQVLARVSSVKKNLVEANVTATLRPSPHKVTPFCRHFGDCGGCPWQDLDYEAQLMWKRGRVEATLARIAKLEADVPPVIASPARQGYRNKMEYAFAPDGVGVALGLRRRASLDICPIDFCPLQSPESGAVLRAVREWAAKHAFSAWDGQRGVLRYLVLREPAYQPEGKPERMVELICGEVPPAPAQQELWATLGALGVTSFMVSQRRNRLALAKGEKTVRRFGRETLREKIGHLMLEFPAQGFVQTNTAAATLLYGQVRSLAALKGGETVWDVYSGVGSLGLFLADQASALLGLELEKEAVRIAIKNAAALGFSHCRFVAGDAAKMLPAQNGQPHLLVTDPPRGGMSPTLIPVIKAKSPDKIIYVSCDPATLARDAAALAPKYSLEEIRVVDMFPHTPHIETVALLRRTDI